MIRIEMPNKKVYRVRDDRTMEVMVPAHRRGLDRFVMKSWREIKPRADVLAAYDRIVKEREAN